MEVSLEKILPKAWRIIDEGVKGGLHSGGQIYVSKAGQIVIDTSFGWREPDLPMRPNDLMPWLSNSKPLTAIALARLVENNRLSFNDPVSDWIPEFAPGGKETVTIEHLLTHTGGLREADKIPEDLSWDETIERICAIPLDNDWVPGQTAGYHFSGSWFILGEILQRITGVRWADYIKQDIFLPLEMKDSFASLSSEELEKLENRIAPMFVTSGGKSQLHPTLNSPESMLVPRPGSSGRGPIRELARIYEMLLADGMRERKKLLEASTVRLLTKPHRVGLSDRTFRHKMDWGLGFIVNSNQYGAETLPYSFGRHASTDTLVMAARKAPAHLPTANIRSSSPGISTGCPENRATRNVVAI